MYTYGNYCSYQEAILLVCLSDIINIIINKPLCFIINIIIEPFLPISFDLSGYFTYV